MSTCAPVIPLPDPAVCAVLSLALILIFLWRVYERGGVLDLVMATRGLTDICRAWRSRETDAVG
jgi:hypothetical protein